MCRMPQLDRLTGLDASFLHLERHGAHMHVGSCLIFDGPAPEYSQLVAHVASRLDAVPRYRQRLAEVPFGQGRPVWVDDPFFNIGYHVRHKALPAPGDDAQLTRMCGRSFSTQLDRGKPLWEISLVEGLADGRFALIGKTHHALIDGVSGVDITAVLFDITPEPQDRPRPSSWSPSPLPSQAELLTDALLERATVPAEIARSVRAGLRTPVKAVEAVATRIGAIGSLAAAGAEPVPDTPLNVEIGHHRRFLWTSASLRDVKDVKDALGGTVNDVVLTAVAGALGSHFRSRGFPTRDLVLRAMVPVSVRPDQDRGALGNQVAAMWAPLPVGETDPVRRLAAVTEGMAHVKESGQAVGAKALTELAGFAPQTIMSQAARLVPRQRFFNLVVTNVPGPQFPLYLMGRQLRHIYPMVPLAERQALGIAVMSYDGRLDFGLNGDWDAMDDLDLLVEDLRSAMAELVAAARKARRRSSRKSSGAAKPARESSARAEAS